MARLSSKEQRGTRTVTGPRRTGICGPITLSTAFIRECFCISKIWQNTTHKTRTINFCAVCAFLWQAFCRMVQIAIIGGGIGGLTAALALQQSGFEAAVFEQAPVLLDVGAAIALWPNAMRVLERLDLTGKILERAGVIEEIRWLDQNGRLINKVSI